MYWLVRAKWDGIYDKTKEFIDNNYWENGYDDKFISIVNSIDINDVLLLADGSYIKYFANCTENLQDGKKVLVSKWQLLKEPIYIPAKGNYIQTISKINNKKYIKRIQNYIEDDKLQDFKILSLKALNFMSLPSKKIELSDKINIFIGENGSGKSQILHLLYSIIDANNILAINNEKSIYEIQRAYASSINDIFKADKLGNLVSKSKQETKIDIELDTYDISFKFNINTTKEIEKHKLNFQKSFVKKKAVFIPTKEVLSFYKGFRVLYEDRYIEFNKTYYNLCKSLEGPLKKQTDLDNVILELEKILKGYISIDNGKFYLNRDNEKFEINLVAEGLRKIGLLAYLLKNGSLEKNSILFWDEPESNLHPKLIDDIVHILVVLANSGVQIFITTHSPYIIESFNNHLKRYKIKNYKIYDNEIENIELLNPKDLKAYLFENSEAISIVDKQLGLMDDKLLQNFNDINILYEKMRDIEWDAKS